MKTLDINVSEQRCLKVAIMPQNEGDEGHYILCIQHTEMVMRIAGYNIGNYHSCYYPMMSVWLFGGVSKIREQSLAFWLGAVLRLMEPVSLLLFMFYPAARLSRREARGQRSTTHVGLIYLSATVAKFQTQIWTSTHFNRRRELGAINGGGREKSCSNQQQSVNKCSISAQTNQLYSATNHFIVFASSSVLNGCVRETINDVCTFLQKLYFNMEL